MSENRAFASLSSGLLARKGAAKPAMRPQGFGSFGAGLEDLGWNDMGHTPEHVPSSIDALTPVGGRSVAHDEAAEPPVVEQRRALEENFASEPETVEAVAAEPAPVVRLPRRRAVAKSAPVRAKAAFTLRLDPDRHLRLRLACTLSRRSAQQLVTEALDDFLNAQPELEELAGRVPAEAGRK